MTYQQRVVDALAIVGGAMLLVAVVIALQPRLQSVLEYRLLQLVDVSRSVETADDFSAEQSRVTRWLGRQYRVGRQPMRALVAEAYALGEQWHMDPLVLLATAAVQSRFNPLADNGSGAVGVMLTPPLGGDAQWLPYGGNNARFDAVANFRVGALLLRDAWAVNPDLEAGLLRYTARMRDDPAAVTQRIMTLHQRLQRVAGRA